MRLTRILFQAAAGGGKGSWEEFLFARNGYNKLGLLKDDLLQETAAVKEAIRRLPDGLYDERVFRLKRAAQLSLSHRILPEEQWTKFQEDKPYLTPYVEEVQKEIDEKKNWGKK